MVTAQERPSASGRIFLDYLRNGRGTCAIGTCSPRARVSFPIAARVTWTHEADVASAGTSD
jgi:DNA primase